MLNIRFLVVSLFGIGLLSGCVKEQIVPASNYEKKLKSFAKNASPTKKLNHWVLPQSTDFASIPQDPKNPLSKVKVELGNFLFFETAFATAADFPEGVGTYSCASCHIPSAGFRPGAKQGIADGGLGYGLNGEGRLKNTKYQDAQMDVQGARPLSVLNVAFVENTLWSGGFGTKGVNVGTEDKWVGLFHTNVYGYEALESQNIEGMVLHKFVYDSSSVAKHGYQAHFDEAFPEFGTKERYSNLTASLAISAYLRTLLTTEAPFQKWLKGDETAMSTEEKKGGILFFGKAGCTNCHKGPGFSSTEFHAVGVNNMYQQPSFNTSKDDRRNLGRAFFTEKAEDEHKFKVPQLYNMKGTPFYFHGSSHTNLESVVQYFNKAVPENPEVPKEQISEYFVPLNLSDEEVKQLTLFLEKSLDDPNLTRYKPKELLSGLCFPNADEQSAKEIGCK